MGGVASDSLQRVRVIKNQAKNMTEWFHDHYENYSKPVFVCGDFNAYPNEVQEIMSSNWNLLSATGRATHSTGKCLDYIFSYKQAAQVAVVDTLLVTSVDTTIAPHGVGSISDHLPIGVKVNILP